ncbi:MAG: HD domain-containing protein [Deltaproteobacteria bacterium]|nr:HD domain-containing protein [Deltaproteobacteria bacterium]
MDESRSLGNCSSAARRDHDAGVARLKKVTASPLVSELARALGDDANLHLVGGTVREALIDAPLSDLDFACAFTPEKTSSMLTAKGIRVVETGLKHGTVTAVMEQQHLEITTFRKPGASRPDDYSQSIEEDLAGRDFTINAIAFSLSTLQIIDPFCGGRDLDAGLVRAVGSPSDRFQEDPLRVLRMFRFGPAAGRTVDTATQEAARAAAATLSRVSAERIHEELTRILISAHASDALRMMLKLEVMAVLLPEVLPSVGFEQNDFHIHDVFEHTLWVLDRCPPTTLLRWSALFHDLGKPVSLSVDENGRRHFYRHEEYSTDIAEQVMRRLRFSNHDIDAIKAIVRHHMRPLECGPSGVRRLIRDLGEQFDDWRIFKGADAPPKITQEDFDSRLNQFNTLYEAELKRRQGSGLPKLAISGNDLIDLGLAPGRPMGMVLKQLEEMIIENPELNERPTLLDEAQKLIAKLSSSKS